MENNFGLRKGYSAAYLLDLSTILHQPLKDSTTTLDIAGVFHSEWYQGLITKLQSLGIYGNILHLPGGSTHGHVPKVVINVAASECRPADASVPQGRVLGPVLSTLMI